MFAPEEFYATSSLYHLEVFDISDPEACEQLHRERAHWQGDGDLEALDEVHFVLLVRPTSSWTRTS